MPSSSWKKKEKRTRTGAGTPDGGGSARGRGRRALRRVVDRAPAPLVRWSCPSAVSFFFFFFFKEAATTEIYPLPLHDALPILPGRLPAEPVASVFRLASDFAPAGDQPRAIDRLVTLIGEGRPHSVLLGITGSGKTFTLANVISRRERPALGISPNQTLAADRKSVV